MYLEHITLSEMQPSEEDKLVSSLHSHKPRGCMGCELQQGFRRAFVSLHRRIFEPP
jgi:hypothetical protein